MSKKQNIFVRSLHELKSTRCIAVTALLIAINITLDLLGLTIKLPPNLRIGFGFLCNAAIGMLFGPVVGMMAGVCTDVLGYFAGNLSMGAYFPGYTLTAVVGGLIWGLWLYPRKITVWRAIGAKACINVFCNICLNTLWLTITGGKAMSLLLVTRVPKNLILLPLEIVLVYVVMRLVCRIYSALPGTVAETAASDSAQYARQTHMNVQPSAPRAAFILPKSSRFSGRCVLTAQNTDVRKFLCRNFLPLKVKKPRRMSPVSLRLHSKRFFMRAAARQSLYLLRRLSFALFSFCSVILTKLFYASARFFGILYTIGDERRD